MTYDPTKHHRKSIRLRGYDYSQPAAYFVTLCIQNNLCLFGDVVDGEMVLNAGGLMIGNSISGCWIKTAMMNRADT